MASFRILVVLVALLSGCEEQKPVREVSEAESACFSRLADLAIKHSEQEFAQTMADIESGDLLSMLEPDLVEEAQFDKLYCGMQTQCFEGLTREQQVMMNRNCVHGRMKDRVADW